MIDYKEFQDSMMDGIRRCREGEANVTVEIERLPVIHISAEVVQDPSEVTEVSAKQLLRLSILERVNGMNYSELLYTQDFIDKHLWYTYPERGDK